MKTLDTRGLKKIFNLTNLSLMYRNFMNLGPSWIDKMMRGVHERFKFNQSF